MRTEPSGQEQELLANILSFKYDPLGFVNYVFPWGQEGTPLHKMEGPRQWQKDDLQLITDHLHEDLELQRLGLPPRPVYMARSSGRGPGKSALVSMINYWVSSCWLGSTGIITANTEAQLRTRTMAELGKWHTMALNRHWFEKSAMVMRPQPWFRQLVEEQLRIDAQYYYLEAQTWSEENPDAFAGAHSQIGMALTYDEACHDDKTEVMTDKGWKLFEDVKDGDLMLSMDPITHDVDYLRPTRLFKAHRKGKMYEYKAGKTGNFCVTPNHEMYFQTYSHRRSNKRSDWKKQQIQHMSKTYHHIPRHINWNATDIDRFEIPGFVSARCTYPSRQVDFDTWAVFLGWYVSEGHTIKRKFKNGIAYLGVGISQLPGVNLDQRD